MRETRTSTTHQMLTLELEGVTAGDYLTWVRDPEPQALDRELRSIEVEAEPAGSRITAILEWAGDPPNPKAAASAAGLPVTVDVRAVYANRSVTSQHRRRRPGSSAGTGRQRALSMPGRR